MLNSTRLFIRKNRISYCRSASWCFIDCMAVIFVLYYSAINAIVVQLALNAGFDFDILGYQPTTYVCVLFINIAALRIYIRGIHFSVLQKCFALYMVAFIYLSIQHDPEWILKDFLYLSFMVLPSTIIFLGYINRIINDQTFFMRPNFVALGVICVMLIILIPSNIELRASLLHLNANTYSTFGAYLMLAAITYTGKRVESFVVSLSGILVALAILAYANSVGITFVLIGAMIFSLLSGIKISKKVLLCFSFCLIAGAFNFSRFNDQKISLSDRTRTLVSNHSSTLYDRLSVYKYAGENFWDHFLVGSKYSLPDIHTAHNILIEIFLITGIFGVAIFSFFAIISFFRWFKALACGNESVIFIALLYFFSFFESLFRGRVVYSVLLIVFMATSFDGSFAKFISQKEEKS